MSHVRIVLPNQIVNETAVVEVDGIDYARELRGVNVSTGHGRDTHDVVLHLNLPTAHITADAQVTVAPEQQRLLVALGWTRPGETKHIRQVVAEEVARALEQYRALRDLRRHLDELTSSGCATGAANTVPAHDRPR